MRHIHFKLFHSSFHSLEFLLMLLVFTAIGIGTAQSEVILNGDFSQGFSYWSLPGSPAVQYTIIQNPLNGSNGARVDSRASVDQAPRQDVTFLLQAAGPGTSYTTRFWVSIDAPASVRCILRISDANGIRKEILAERVIRVPNQWTEAEGTHRVHWADPLISATVYFEAEKVSEGIFPGLSLDDLTMELDSDGDQLTDPHEVSMGTDPLRRDSDSDGMPDGYEVANRLLPSKNDAKLDADLDKFSNLEEYWAATNPNDPSSFPGKHSNPNADSGSRRVLSYLSLLPTHSRTRVVVGQHLTYPAPPPDEYAQFVTGLYAATRQYPGLLALQYDDNTNALQIGAVNPYAIDYWNQGGLVQIKWNPLNPWTQGHYGDRTFFGFHEVITPGYQAHANYMVWLDEVAQGLAELQNAGVVVLWRVCSEMNGAWFWWGRRDRQGYIDFWRHMYDYLTNQKKLNNLIWVYEADSSVHTICPADYYYPGDDVVDVMGHNLYNDTWILPFDAELLFRRYPKVYAVPQAGPSTIKDGSWSNLIFLNGNPSGAGGMKNLYPRLSYFAAWNSFWTWDPVLKKSVYRSMAIVDNKNAQELMKDSWVVTRKKNPAGN